MSAHGCNNLCSNDLLHFAQKALGVEDADDLRAICEEILNALDRN